MAGLIVTCARHFEPDACDEIEKILADLGDESAYAKATSMSTSMSGIITVETSLDPENAINNLTPRLDDIILDSHAVIFCKAAEFLIFE